MTKIQKDNKNVAKFPNLRFPEFTEEWNREKIVSILTIGSGKDYKHLSKGTIPVFGTGGYMASVDDFLYEGESVCIGRKGTINKPLYFNGKFWTVDTLFYTHSFKNVLPKFVYNIFEQINWLKYNEASGVPSLSKSTIEQIDINIPCVEEQQKIATFLSLIDERIQTQNKIIGQLETLIKGLSENLFSQKIRFKKFEKKWEVKTLGEILIEINERTINSNQYRVLSSTAKGLFYQSDYFNKEVASKDSAGYKILKFNQLVFSPQNLWLGNINVNTTYEIGIVSPSYKVFSFNEKAIVSYCKYFLKSSKMMFEYEQCSEQGASIVRRNLNMDLFLNIPILLPKLEEQIQISSFLTKIDQKIQTEKAILEQLEIQKKYLLQQMFV